MTGRGCNQLTQDRVEWLLVKNNESSASILGLEFREQLSYHKLFKKIPIQCSYRNVYLIRKGKAVPLQAWSGPEGCRKLRFPDYMTNGTGWW
jgi:hypothetical protein